MEISHLLVNHIHHGMVGAIVAGDLWVDSSEAIRKIRSIALLMLAQHSLKRFFPSLFPSTQVMVGVACYVHVAEKHKYPSYLIALITTGIALRALSLEEHYFLDLGIAILAGRVFGTLWNYSFS